MAPLNETLGSYSELFMLLATATYVVAFLAFAWDMATSGRTARRDAPGPAGAEPAKAPALAAAGGGKGPGPNRPAPPAGPAPAAPGNGLAYTARRNPARVGVALSIVGVAIHAAGVVTRGIAAGRVPWGNMYEFCTTGAFLVVAVFLLALIRRDLRFLGTFVTGLALVMMTAGAVAFWTPVGHLVPALQSYWLVIHVSIAVLSSALFTLTFCLSVLQLIQARHEAKAAAGGLDRGGFLALVPPSGALEALAYRINTIGFVTWSLTLLFGAMWAEKAWGRFWGWDPKEVWTFIIWVVYAAYLHARATRGWTGTRAAWLSITGYLCVVFNFTVVNVFINGLHSYAGLPS